MNLKDITWRTNLEQARAEAVRLRRPLVVKPANQGINGTLW